MDGLYGNGGLAVVHMKNALYLDHGKEVVQNISRSLGMNTVSCLYNVFVFANFFKFLGFVLFLESGEI